MKELGRQIRTAVITGATSGIGFSVLQEMVRRGWHCIAVGRSEERMAAADLTIRQVLPQARVNWCRADLSVLAQVNHLVTEIQSILSDKACVNGVVPLDALVLCAGMVTQWYQATPDGYETQFAVNHLSQMRLAMSLLPQLAASGQARLLTVSSGSHYHTRVHWEDIMMRRRYHPLFAYKQSKLCNVLFASEWNRRHGDKVIAFAVDPGLVDTDIGAKGTTGVINLFWRWRRKSGTLPEIPTRTMLHLLESPIEKTVGHLYWKDARPSVASRVATDPAEAARLWELSCRLI